MSEFFLAIVNMSISAGWIVLAVLILRLLLKKAPKWISVMLWGIVAIRLICPFSVESVLSLIPSAQTISPEIMMDKTPTINSGISILNSVVNPVIVESFAPNPGTSANPLQILIPIMSIIWIVGIFVMLAYTVISYFRLKRKIGTAVMLRENVFQSESVVSPFVLGIVKPKIYLPFNVNERDMEHVIAHEKAHIRRKDHLWKPFGFLILTLHWFNPLMWLAYVLLCRDIELACDEKVIKELSTEQKADYSQALLTCSVDRRIITACPLAFGEVGVKDRVKSVLNYKKPAFWIIISAILASVVAAICFLTNPRTTLNDELSVFIDMQVAEHNYSEGHTDGNFVVTSHKILDVDEGLNKTTVYMWSMYQEYSCENGVIKNETGSHIPTIITAKRTGNHGHYELVEYWTPRDGSYYVDDIREKFPWYLHSKALDSQRYVDEQMAFCHNSAEQYFGADGENVLPLKGLEELRKTHPQLFNVSTDGGLKVYIWHVADEHYRCYLVNGKVDAVAEKSFAFKDGITMGEMRQILSTYNVEKKDIVIRRIDNPLSNTNYQTNDLNRLEEMFWSDNVYVEGSSLYYYALDTAVFDIDGDGKKEHCVLSPGTVSMACTFGFTVIENNQVEFFNVFECAEGDLFFVETKDGVKLLLKNLTSSEEIYYTIGVEDGNIVLVSNDENLKYFGEQGTESKYSPKAIGDLNVAVASAIKDKYRAEKPDGLIHTESYYVLHHEYISGTPSADSLEHRQKVVVYLLVNHTKYSVGNGELKEVNDGLVPTIITFTVDRDYNYTLEEYWTPIPGVNYEKDIRTRFPGITADSALNMNKYKEDLIKECKRQATETLEHING